MAVSAGQLKLAMMRYRLPDIFRKIKAARPLSFLAVLVVLVGTCSGRSLAADKPQGILLAAGDITSCDAGDVERAGSTAALLKKEIDAARQQHIPVKVAVLGDLAYNDGTQAQFECFQRAWGKVLDESLADPKSDVLPVPGNHDYRVSQGKWFYRYFESNRWIGSEHHPYYQLTFPATATGAWRLFGLNSEIDSNSKSEQYAWLKKNLEASVERCVLAFWHRPVFSSGRHGHDESDRFATAEPIKQNEMADIEALLSVNGASIILNGHDHDYEELEPHNEAGQLAPDGLRSFVVGTGGRQLYELYAHTWPLTSRTYDINSNGILKLSLFPDKYFWSFLSVGADAAVKYRGNGTCNRRKSINQ